MPTATPSTQSSTSRRHEKSEKGEKGREKGEKPEKGRGDLRGPIIGGGILIWLGLLVYLDQAGIIQSADIGGLFLMGIGVLLILGGLMGKTTTGRPMLGFLIGGVVAIVIGVGSLRGFNFLGPFVGAVFLVLIGLLVIFLAVNARRSSPAPIPPAPT